MVTPAGFIALSGMGITLGSVLFSVFAIVAGLTVLITFALFYHWARYNPGVISTVFVMGIYSAGVLLFLLSLWGIIAQI